MPLHRIKEFDPDYRNHFDNQDIIGSDVYSGNEKVGSVDDLLVDDNGSFRYFVVNTGLWIFGKKVLLPIGRSRVSQSDRRVYVDNLSRSQVENLPAYDENSSIDYDYEERVRGSYRTPAVAPGDAPVDRSAAVGNVPLDNTTVDSTAYDRSAYTRDDYSYDRDPDLYNLDERNHQNFRLYEERLIADKQRRKTGEVAVGKHVETETARVSVPVEKERVVIERTNPTDVGTPVAAGDADFREGEVARIDVYEEVPDIHKETIVREEVNVRKEVDRDTAEAEDQLRREELDVDTQGRPAIDKRPEEGRNRRI